MKVYSYYPGCTLKTKAAALDRSGRLALEKLGIRLEELPEWQCCGGTYPLSKDEIAVKLGAVRALAAARDAGHELVTLCSACYNVLKQVNNDMQNDPYIQERVNAYLAADGISYHGETHVLHYLEVLRDVVGWDAVKAAVKKAGIAGVAEDVRIGAYYGCLLLRPSMVLQFDDPENPQILEDFIASLGAEPVVYAQRNECCGAYAQFENPSIPAKRAGAVLADAASHGASVLVTSCPLCKYNLEKHGTEVAGTGTVSRFAVKAAVNDVPRVMYFTELLAQALGVEVQE